MCFSASASFGAGALLSVVGVLTVKKVRKPSQIPLAAIPLIFAIQQITEGFLWLTLTNPDYEILQQFTTYAFLFFAQVVWPVWVPFSILKFETNHKRRQILRVLTGIGALVSAWLAWCLLAYTVSAEISGHHIAYTQDYPENLSRFGGILYVVATIMPPFLSTVKRMWLVGLLILVSYIMTTIFYENHVVSVWCFFAAIISAVVLLVVHGQGNRSMRS